MYEFHYNYVKPKWVGKSEPLFTDTDSLCCEIRTNDIYEDISGDVDKWFDTCDLDPNHPSGLHSNKNKKVLGLLKDECGGDDIVEFVGLRPKSYAYETAREKVGKKCKGVKQYVIKKHITIEDYKE